MMLAFRIIVYCDKTDKIVNYLPFPSLSDCQYDYDICACVVSRSREIFIETFVETFTNFYSEKIS